MNRTANTFAAVDLGASSGRVIRGVVGPDTLDTFEVHRFPNQPRTIDGALRWDFTTLERETAEGLRQAGQLDGIGIDSWAVDYGLLNANGRLLADPIHYRDQRTASVPERVFEHITAQRLYQLTGIQDQPFNTIHQLYADRENPTLTTATRALLIPDLLAWRFTGVAGTEITNASTTGLLDPDTRTWSGEILDALALDPKLFAPLREPGEPAGYARDFGAPVLAVGSHDTASAVAAVPAETENFAYISSGTWSLVGVELSAPIRTERSRAANFTNELGVDGTVRYLRNVMGFWLLQECLREWRHAGGHTSGHTSGRERGHDANLPALLDAAAHAPARRSLIDATDPAFLPPGRMPERIAAACRAAGQPVPRTRAETVRCILDSLAEAYRRTLTEAADLSGKRIDVVHVVGGGARNALLCQLTANALGLPVLAGPVEATALGNLLLQARATGAVTGDLPELRALIARTQPLRRYEPQSLGPEPQVH